MTALAGTSGGIAGGFGGSLLGGGTGGPETAAQHRAGGKGLNGSRSPVQEVASGDRSAHAQVTISLFVHHAISRTWSC
jgi:hypothetical protein